MKRHLVKSCAWLLTAALLATAGWAPASAAPARDTAWGDVDKNGAVNAADALLALQHSVHLTALDAAASLRADVNGDGAVNAADALLILQYSVKLIDRFPVVDTLPPLITVTFDTGDKPVTLPPVTGESGEPLDPPTVPPVDGWRLDGWLLDGEPYVFTAIPDQDITLTAAWTRVSTVFFDCGGGQPTEPITAEPGSPLTLPVLPDWDGHAFYEWLLNGKKAELTVMPEESVTLTARWKGQYKLTFQTGAEGLDPPPVYLFPGEPIVAPLVAPREGYILSGWLYNGARYPVESAMPHRNLNLTADWKSLTNLPVLLVELRDDNGMVYPLASVDRETYVKTTYSFLNMPDGSDLAGLPGQFRGRGNGSWASDKKGYRIKFDKKQSLFGRPKDKNWVLLACTNGDDQTLCRNWLAFNMCTAVFDGIEYATSANWVELYVNGEYRGVYVLAESVRVAEGRVDIDPTPVDGDDLSFLVEYDSYATGTRWIDYFRADGLKYRFSVHYPDYEDYAAIHDSSDEFEQTIHRVRDYVNAAYAAGLGGDYARLCELVDIDSLVDMYILQEYFKNADAGWSSFFLYKRPGGKLFFGPPWDFDATASVAHRGDETPFGIYVGDTEGESAAWTSSELFIALYKNPDFLQAVKRRWAVLSPRIRTYLDNTFNNKFYSAYKTGLGRNFVWWNGRTQEAAEQAWVTATSSLKAWFVDRAVWLDKEWALN